MADEGRSCDNDRSSKNILDRYVDNEILHLVIITILFALVLFWTDQNGYWGDVYAYWRDASMAFSGKAPYHDFTFEYPPVAMLLFSIPYAVASNAEGYRLVFAFLSYLAVIACYWFGRRIAEGFGVRPIMVFAVIVAMILFANYYIVSRYDIFPAAMILIAFWFFRKERYALAFIIMALAAMLKIYPILFIPLMLCIFVNRREYVTGAKYLVLSAVVCVICEIPFLLIDPSTSFDYLTYHSDRRIQVEAVIANFLQVYGDMNPGQVWWVNEYGADHLAGPLPDALAPLMNPLMMVIVSISIIFMIWRLRRIEGDRLWALAGLAFALLLMIFLAVNKVYSNQYMIWACAMIPLALIGVSKTKDRRIVFVASMAFIALSDLQTLWFHLLGNPWEMGSFTAIQALKNAAHIILLAVLAYYFAKGTREPRSD